MRRGLAAIVAVAALGPHAVVRSEPASSSQVVTIDVIPSDARGRVLEDLKPADFELKEEGAAQSLESVRLVRDDARLLAIFLDEYHVSPGPSTTRARAALRRLVDNQVSPRDSVIVFKPLDSLMAIHPTSDLEDVRQAIESFEGRKGDYQPRNAYERDFFALTPAKIDAARNQVALSAINALAVHLGAEPDRRKALVILSEGMAGIERRRGGEYVATLETIHRSADRANVAVYTVDPRDVADDSDSDGLRRIASQTNGQAIAGDLDSGLRAAITDSAAYYMLVYHSVHPEDGKFHGVQVRVKRAGASVRARDGYWATSPDEVLRASILESINHPKPAAPLEPPPHVSPIIKPWFGESRGADGKTRLTFVWEPASHIPGDRSRQMSPSRLLLTAKTADGTVLFEGPVSPTGPAFIDDPGLTSAQAVFDSPPGRLRLRMSIQDVTQRVLDQDVRDMSVRDLRGEVAVGSPEILRARNAREFRTLGAGDAVPVASREFSRTEHLLVRFRAYGADGAPPTVSAKILVRSGAVVRELTVTPAGTPDAANVIDLPLAWLAQGEYMLQVSASDGKKEAKDRVAFRVTP
ncbi:MAG TPA: VWA domain-containing protein [Vicinamibacterales bacterium]